MLDKLFEILSSADLCPQQKWFVDVRLETNCQINHTDPHRLQDVLCQFLSDIWTGENLEKRGFS